jgi:hypothetical protein
MVALRAVILPRPGVVLPRIILRRVARASDLVGTHSVLPDVVLLGT